MLFYSDPQGLSGLEKSLSLLSHAALSEADSRNERLQSEKGHAHIQTCTRTCVINHLTTNQCGCIA